MRCSVFFLCLVLALPNIFFPVAQAADIQLPVFGDATSGVISQQQEYELGREWLRAYRSRIPLIKDAELQFYLEQMLFDLAEHSDLQDHRLELILINNASMNAFAVPGGVIGVHTGLFRFAGDEHQLASVLSHEIAHLSQRHFARRLGKQKANQYLTYAGLLASLIIGAAAGTDAGLAGVAATQAAAIDSALRYSRQNEQEADRLGIETLYKSGLDPKAAPAMFEGMLKATRYIGSRPPEFLLTHPLTESRIADAYTRARTYPDKQYQLSPDYPIMKARALMSIEKSPALSIKRFKSELSGDALFKDAARYGLSLSYLANNQPVLARQTLTPLIRKEPKNLHFLMADISIDLAQSKYQRAIGRLQQTISHLPNYYPAKSALAEAYQQGNQFYAAELQLEEMLQTRPEDPFIWYDLAEVRGLAGNISGVHLARAEYFILVGVFDKARRQLGFARKLLTSDYRQVSIIDQRLRDLEALQKDRKL